MKEIRDLELRMEAVKICIEFLNKSLAKYRREEQQLTWDLNKARRLEREARGLPQ